MARERRQPVRRFLWALIRLIPVPVRRLLWEGILDLPAPVRRLFWWSVVRKDRIPIDLTAPDLTESVLTAAERRLRFPKPQIYDVILFQASEVAAPSPFGAVARRFAADGHRVFYVGERPDPAADPAIDRLADGIYAVLPTQIDGPDGKSPGRTTGRNGERFWTALRYDYSVVDAVCWVTAPEALGHAGRQAERFGWKVVLDTREPSGSLGRQTRDSSESGSIDLHVAGVADETSSVPSGSASRVTLSRASALSDDAWRTLKDALLRLYPKVSILTVVYNGLDYNRLCLESIFGKTAYPNFEVIVVDNKSADGTTPYLDTFASEHPNVKVLKNLTNLGYTLGNNQAAASATGDYLVFLNNDTILNRSWLSRLIYHVRDPRVGMVGPTSSWPGNESGIETSYRTLTELHAFADRYTRAHEGETYDARRMIFFCATMRRGIWDEIGPLDERFSKGWSFEDDDYTMRVRQRGYRIIYARDAFVHHWGAGSGSRRDLKQHWRLIEINRRQFEEKWGVKWDPQGNVTAPRVGTGT